MTLTYRTNSGEMRVIAMSEIDDLAAAMRGRLVRRDTADYDEARQIWNAMIDRRPALIARCHGTADVMAAVKFAASHDMALCTRGGGHNIAGSALCDDGLVIDLSPMRGVRVDPVQRRAWVQGGALLGDVDHETQAFGLAVPLGGGFGWLSRAFGHTVDNIVVPTW